MPSRRTEVGSAWTSRGLVVVGGYNEYVFLRDVHVYDVVGGTWSALPPLPDTVSARSYGAVVEAGSDILVWGGTGHGALLRDGAVYSYATGSWRVMSTSGAPSMRSHFAYAWDAVGQRFIVWGGHGPGMDLGDGFTYSPAADAWEPMPTAPIEERSGSAFAWDPERRRLYIWGGSAFQYEGAYFDAANDTWTELPDAPPETASRTGAGAVVAGGSFLFVGGWDFPPAPGVDAALTDGAVFDPATASWSMLPPSGLSPRGDVLAATDGRHAFFWGGFDGGAYLSDGAVFDTSSGTWTSIPPCPDGPPSGTMHAAVGWSPLGVAIWGGTTGTLANSSEGAIWTPP